MNKVSIVLAACICALLMGAPVYGTLFQYLDPDEAAVPTQGYDLEYIRLDDHDGAGSNLTLEYTTYGTPLLTTNLTDYVNITMWIDIGGFNQDPNENPTIFGVAWDFEIRWYGSDDGVGGTPLYDLEFVIRGQDGQDMDVPGTHPATPGGTNTLTLQVPWAKLVNSVGGLAVPGQELNPPSFQFLVQFDNDHFDMADDIYPEEGWQEVPEPLTMLGLFMGLGGVGAYIRRRRMA